MRSARKNDKEENPLESHKKKKKKYEPVSLQK